MINCARLIRPRVGRAGVSAKIATVTREGVEPLLASVVDGQEARALCPAIAWPTLALAAALAPVHMLLVAAGLSGVLPIWWLTPLLGLSAYAHYTIVHEAIHRNIVRSRRFDPVNGALGWWGSLTLGNTWPLFHRTHIAHHAHTNTDRDADLFVKGSLTRLIWLGLLSVPLNLVPVPLARRLFARLGLDIGYLDIEPLMPREEWRLHIGVHGLLCLAVWLAVALGFGAEAFALYVLPSAMGRLLIGVFLAWMPHHPFDDSDRYRTTRVLTSPLAKIMCMGHHLHLVHHLWPSVPFYRYPQLFALMRPALEERGARL